MCTTCMAMCSGIQRPQVKNFGWQTWQIACLSSARSQLYGLVLSLVQISNSLLSLGQVAVQTPQQWAPVAAILLLKHAYQLSFSTIISWLGILAKSAQQPRSHLQPAQMRDQSAQHASIWLCRFARELAAAWPFVLCSSGSASAAAAEAAGTSSSELWAQWKVSVPPRPALAVTVGLMRSAFSPLLC